MAGAVGALILECCIVFSSGRMWLAGHSAAAACSHLGSERRAVVFMSRLGNPRIGSLTRAPVFGGFARV